MLESTNRDHFVNAPSQWETTLQCNVVSHWLGAYTKWSLHQEPESTKSHHPHVLQSLDWNIGTGHGSGQYAMPCEFSIEISTMREWSVQYWDIGHVCVVGDTRVLQSLPIHRRHQLSPGVWATCRHWSSRAEATPEQSPGPDYDLTHCGLVKPYGNSHLWLW